MTRQLSRKIGAYFEWKGIPFREIRGVKLDHNFGGYGSLDIVYVGPTGRDDLHEVKAEDLQDFLEMLSD